MMMLALARLVALLRDQPATLVATVHDEVVFLEANDGRRGCAPERADFKPGRVEAWADVG